MLDTSRNSVRKYLRSWSDQRQLVLPVGDDYFCRSHMVIIRYRRCRIGYGSASRITQAKTDGRKETTDGGGHGGVWESIPGGWRLIDESQELAETAWAHGLFAKWRGSGREIPAELRASLDAALVPWPDYTVTKRVCDNGLNLHGGSLV